ncbi:hypothetical protein ACIGXA_07440 [Streptomyces fildesensis]|uniref:Uncharacterized protein n=1 Tax=Streptomyces fildesensis TaxID=375757 RepID=A0ABW8C1P4_9ACTN
MSRPKRARKRADTELRARRERRISRGGGVLMALALVALLLAGGALVKSQIGELGWRTGLSGARETMTIVGCRTTHKGRNSATECVGHGDPGGTGVTPEEWLIKRAFHEYPEGTVLSVRCTPTGGCFEQGVGPAAGPVGGIAIGLALLTGAAALVRLFVLMLLVHRGRRDGLALEQPYRPRRYPVIAWCALLGLTIAGSVIVTLVA